MEELRGVVGSIECSLSLSTLVERCVHRPTEMGVRLRGSSWGIGMEMEPVLGNVKVSKLRTFPLL